MIYLMYCNDIPEIIENSLVLQYADDTKIFASVSTMDDILKLQSDINSLVEWGKNNSLQLNRSKTVHVRFSKFSITNYPMGIADSNNSIYYLQIVGKDIWYDI